MVPIFSDNIDVQLDADIEGQGRTSQETWQKMFLDDLYECVEFAFSVAFENYAASVNITGVKLIESASAVKVIDFKASMYTLGFQLCWTKSCQVGSKLFKTLFPLRGAMQGIIMKDSVRLLVGPADSPAKNLRSTLSGLIKTSEAISASPFFSLQDIYSILASTSSCDAFADFIGANPLGRPLRLQAGFMQCLELLYGVLEKPPSNGNGDGDLGFSSIARVTCSVVDQVLNPQWAVVANAITKEVRRTGSIPSVVVKYFKNRDELERFLALPTMYRSQLVVELSATETFADSRDTVTLASHLRSQHKKNNLIELMAAAVAKNKYVTDFPAVLQRVYDDIAIINDSTASTDAKVTEIVASAISEFFPVEIGTGQGITAERPSVLALADGSTKPDESDEGHSQSNDSNTKVKLFPLVKLLHFVGGPTATLPDGVDDDCIREGAILTLRDSQCTLPLIMQLLDWIRYKLFSMEVNDQIMQKDNM